ncbi:MAG: hypothetical protein KC910_29050 [Candidatus Eremiobacteraeota bacterium]|nr:hypothetical protein [Candidatus Eremiobacteraeota bacterium]
MIIGRQLATYRNLAPTRPANTRATGPIDVYQPNAPSRPVIPPSPHQTALAAAIPGLFGPAGLLLPDSEGRIGHLALQFGNKEFDKPLPEVARKAVLGVYRKLLTNMHPETRFTIVAADTRGVEDLKKLVDETGIANPQRVKIVGLDSEQGFSIWIRDSMLPVWSDQGTRVLVQDRTYFAGPDEQAVPFNLPVQAEAHPGLRLDGGNILSNRHQVIVGIDSVEHTAARLRELVGGDRNWNELAVKLFEHEFGKPALVVGKDDPDTPEVETQPAFHIDMVATPIGEENFMVGDPGLASRVLAELSPEQRAEVNQKMAAAAGLDSRRDLVGELLEENANHQANFDNLARELSPHYEVERIPCLLGQRFTHSLPYLTYNNCIMEVYDDVKKVYLPQYDCEPLDRLARQSYERHGFEVVPLDMAAITVLEGAIRCSSYALERHL